ncbi:hypothetical protein BU16DRAFT_557616 [Lophium mytilinum]|uniref:Uncharacterized protein n=1 Tax=Lophium mytilinum TaxID=390894 RepID=A0A6A6R4P3_9PEZI|nr:hypothetical protein BU16DRAFT_557616 [Lophium mytilinum]
MVAATPTIIKREDGQQTPITPPAAYLDFLKTLSPVLMSPLPTGSSSKFTFGDRPSLPETRPRSTSSITSLASTASITSALTSTSGSFPADRPSPTSSVSSRSSSCSNCGPASPPASRSPAPVKTEKADMNIVIPPPSPFMRPMSARTPRLFIPPSPYSAGIVAQSPMSAHSVRSPYSATMSPRTWDLEKKGNTTSRRVSVREVVTRTVTYSRTPVETTAPAFPPLDPAPKGKRRRIE